MNYKKLLYALVILFVLYDFKAWIFIKSQLNWAFILGSLIYLLLLGNAKNIRITPKKIVFILLSFFAYAYARALHDFGGFVGGVLSLSAIYSILLIKDKDRMELMNIFDKVMYFITIPSVVGWILYLLHVPLPHTDFDWEASVDSFYQFKCYYVFLFWDRGLISDVFPRFSSIFYEPGYYATILVFLITYHRFDFKRKQVNVYLVALILTFSLAGYLMFCIMWAGFSLIRSKSGFLYLMFILIFLQGFTIFFKEYNGGDNAVNNMILVRMEFEDGEWSGYNRTGEDFDDLFIKQMTTGGSEILFGASKSKQKWVSLGNVGWKVYLFRYGLICFFAFIACVILPYSNKKKQVMCLLPMLLFIMIFARGHYVIWYSGFWLLYFASLISLYNEYELNKDNKNAKEYLQYR